jgi:TolA-binding protein
LHGLALADSLYVGPLERERVKVEGYRNGRVELSVAGRAVEAVPREKVTRIRLDGDAVFSAAEQATAEQRWQEAAGGYEAVLRSPARPWYRAWCLPRLVVAAGRSGAWETAASAFSELVRDDPAQAVSLMPAIPAGADPARAKALADRLARLADNAALSEFQRRSIQTLAMNSCRRAGDLEGAARLGQQLLGGILEEKDPAARKLMGEIHLAMAQLSLAKRAYAQAIAQVEEHGELLADPEQQAEALYCLAAAKDGLAEGADPDRLRDIAIAYMRAAGVARKAKGHPYLAESLMRVADIRERLGDRKTAATLYGEVANEYKESPLAARAQAECGRLAQKVGP